MANTLRKIDVNAMIVNQYPLHLEISLFAIFLELELYEGILKAVARSFVTYDFA